MSALALDPIYNDLQFTNGTLTLLGSATPEETAQELNCRLRLGKGEWFLDTQQGFPWFQAVLVKNPDTRAIAQLFRAMILATPGVRAVLSLPVAFDAALRKLTVGPMQIQHDSGAVIVGGIGQPFIVQNNQQVGVQ